MEIKKSFKKLDNGNTICESQKHWFAYFFPVCIILGCVFLLFHHLLWILICPFVIIYMLYLIITGTKEKWILTKDELIMKGGFLPWQKHYIEVPISNIYESYYTQGMLATILKFAEISIRRTEGSTTNLKTNCMTNYELMTQTINSEIEKMKKSNNDQNSSANPMNYSVSDEIFKLKQLYDEKLISEEEFLIQKSRILKNN